MTPEVHNDIFRSLHGRLHMKTLKMLWGIWWRRCRVVLGFVLLVHSYITPFVLLIACLPALLGIWFPSWETPAGALLEGEIVLVVIMTYIALIGGTFEVLDKQRYRRYGDGEFTLEDTLDRLFREDMTLIKNYNAVSLMINLVRWFKLHSNHRHLSLM